MFKLTLTVGTNKSWRGCSILGRIIIQVTLVNDQCHDEHGIVMGNTLHNANHLRSILKCIRLRYRLK